MKKLDKFLLIIVIGIFILGALYLYSHLLIMTGVVKERAEKECVGAVAIANWERTLNIVYTICVDVQVSQLDEIKNFYELQTFELEKDAKYWRDSYFWLKEQTEIIEEEN